MAAGDPLVSLYVRPHYSHLFVLRNMSFGILLAQQQSAILTPTVSSKGRGGDHRAISDSSELKFAQRGATRPFAQS
jgi:hypothetical protein